MRKGILTGIIILFAAMLVFIFLPKQDYNFSANENTEIPYHLTGTSLQNLTPETLQVQIQKKPSSRNIIQTLTPSERRNANQILAVIERYNRAYVLTFFTGKYYKIPEEMTISQDLSNELNARLKQMLIDHDTFKGNANGYRLKLKILNIKLAQDKAKVIIYRDLAISKGKNHTLENFGTPEGYTLEKIDNQWKLVNVLSCKKKFNAACKQLDKSKNPEDWVTKFSYENCPTSQYHKNSKIKKVKLTPASL